MALDLSALTIGSTGWGPPLLAGLLELDAAKLETTVAAATYATKDALVLNVKDYGATGNGVTDDTTAIQYCLNLLPASGGVVVLPPAAVKYNITGLTVTKTSTTILGYGWSSILNMTAATGDAITIGSTVSDVTIRGIFIESSVTRTAGWYINNDSNNFRLEDFAMIGGFGGLRNSGSIVDIQLGSIRECAPTTGVGIQIDGGADLSIRHLVMDNGTNIAAGIKVTSTADLVLEDCNIIHSGDCLLLAPASGRSITSVFAFACYFDTSTGHGLYINAVNAPVARCAFTECWFSSHTAGGIAITTSGTGYVDGIDFNTAHVFLNGSDGIALLSPAVRNIRFNGGAVAGNTGAGATIVANVNNWSFQNMKLGPTHDIGANAYGIYIGGGTTDYWMITNCDLHGNTTAAIAGSSSGTHYVNTPNLT